MTREKFLKEQDTHYNDWFGSGDIIQDLLSSEKEEGKLAKKVFRCGFMILVVFDDKIICKGYDSNEYCHSFEFKTK